MTSPYRNGKMLLVEALDDIHAIRQLLNSHSLTRLRDSEDKSIRPLKQFFGVP